MGLDGDNSRRPNRYLWVDWNGSWVHLQTSCHGVERLAILVWQCLWRWWRQRLATVSLGGTDVLRILFDGVGCGFSGSRFSDGGRDVGVGFFGGSGAVEQGCCNEPLTFRQVVAAKSQDPLGAANPSHLMLDPRKSNFANLNSQTQDSRGICLGKVDSPDRKIFSAGSDDGMSLEVSFKLVRGPSGKWEICWSNVSEVVPSMGLVSNSKPNISYNHIPYPLPSHTSNPKPIPNPNPLQSCPTRGPHSKSKPKTHPSQPNSKPKPVGLTPNPNPIHSKPNLKTTFKWKPKSSQPPVFKSQTHPLAVRSSQAPLPHLSSPATTETGCAKPVGVPVSSRSLSRLEPTCTEKSFSVHDIFEAAVSESHSSDASVEVSLCSDNDVGVSMCSDNDVGVSLCSDNDLDGSLCSDNDLDG
ncbi:hypothetical protein CMV_026819, partial [Castanea mollissima]